MTTPSSSLFRSFSAVALAAALVAGCAGGAGGGGNARADGEKKLNDWVGRSIAGSFLETDELVEKRNFDAARMQYVVPDKSGCTLSFIVDRRTKILLSWTYLREREKCWVSRSAF